MKRIHLLVTFGLMAASLAFGQKAEAPGQTKKDDPIAPERTAVEGAIALTKTTGLDQEVNLNAVEALLTGKNRAKAGSAEWRMETAQRLMHIAEEVARSGKPQNVAPVVRRALQHLKVVDTPASSTEARAAAQALAGFIYERYLADEDAALLSYQAAARLMPDHEQAKEAVERISGQKDNVKLKPVGKK